MRLLGSGGMGEVYLAEHPRLPRRDALKVLPADVSTDPDHRARLNREADLASKLWHSHIVSVHDRGEYEGVMGHVTVRQNRAMKPVGVHHVAICVADAQKGLAFYRDVLGMTQLPRPDLGRGYWLDAGGQQVHLMESDTQPLGANHFAIRVDDIDAAVTDLQEQGVEVHRIPFIPGAGHQAFLHDPFGNLLELNQPE